jgi:hypothetical protein
MSDNLKLWRAVEKTDPSLTKEFNRGGGFKGTAINPTSLVMRATEMFGPPGIGWGYEIVKEEMLVGAPLTETCNELTHCLQVKVWYVLDGKRGEIEQFGATTYVGKNKYGPFTDEEAKKKTLTDAISKCLSWLGFSADVHLGRYDDNKYVNDMRKEFAEQKEKASGEQLEAKKKSYLDELATLTDKTVIQTLFFAAATGLGLQKGTTEFAELRKLFVQRIEEIKPEFKQEALNPDIT